MKKIFFLPIALFALLILSACSPSNPSTPPSPAAVPGNTTGSPALPPPPLPPTEDLTVCTEEYAPVCGKYQVQCIKAPCPPIDTTYSNRCEAEKAGATEIVSGSCEKETSDDKGTSDDVETPEEAAMTGCASNNGIWLLESKECTGISKEACEKMGGTFNECASACRNNPKAEFCTMQCVIVCQFPAL